MSAIRLEKTSKIFPTRGSEVRALDEVDLEVREGEFVVIRGPSGSGKTTLLMTVGGMLRPTRGKVMIRGEDLYAMDSEARARFRARHIGFVFQAYYLVPYLDTLDNALLALGEGGFRARKPEARALLETLGLGNRIHHRPSELSSGERQRAAIARALLNRPSMVLADEPTGNLDPENAEEVIRHLEDYHKKGATVMVITHGTIADRFADRILHLREGRILAEA